MGLEASLSTSYVPVAGAAIVGLGVLAFLAKWIFSSTIGDIRATREDIGEVAKSVTSMVRTLDRHELQINDALVRIGKLEARDEVSGERLTKVEIEFGTIRELAKSTHEKANQIQTFLLKRGEGA